MSNETEKQPQPYQERYRKLVEAMDFAVKEIGTLEVETAQISDSDGNIDRTQEILRNDKAWNIMREFGARIWDSYCSCPEAKATDIEELYIRDVRDFTEFMVRRVERSTAPRLIKRLCRGDGEKLRPEDPGPRSHLKLAG